MRSHPERIFFVLGASHAILHPQSTILYPAAPKTRHDAPNSPIGASRKANAESAGVIQSIITIIRRKNLQIINNLLLVQPRLQQSRFTKL